MCIRDRPRDGAILVMPPDDFYQMPYTWGYYGADSFIVDLFHRRILIASGQGYAPASAQVLNTTNLTAAAILRRDWRLAESLVTALGTPFVMVRRDVQDSYPGRSIQSPDALSNALGESPNFQLIRTVGRLELYEVQRPNAGPGLSLTTVDSQTPDLRLLGLLPTDTALVSSQARRGVPSVIQAPSVETWPTIGQNLVWQPPISTDWSYQLAEIESKKVLPLDRPGSYSVAHARASYTRQGGIDSVSVSIPARTVISNGDFADGLWGPVGDCNNLLGPSAGPNLNAEVVARGAPNGSSALRLSASADGACESQQLDWRGGSVVISLMVHHVQGSLPRICLWETGPERCALLQSIPARSDWTSYRTSFTPDTGTKKLSVFLYAIVDAVGQQTVDEYANIQVEEVPGLPSLALLGLPKTQSPPSEWLFVSHEGYSTQWQGPAGSEHVLVDGMLNGWIEPWGSRDITVHYAQSTLFATAQWVSLVFGLIVVLHLAWISLRLLRLRIL